MDSPLLNRLEKEIDAEFRACFPTDAGWEPAALHLLLVFDRFASDDRYSHQLDALKYPLMHALRWGADAPSVPYQCRPVAADEVLLQRCEDAFLHAINYVGVWGAFASFRRNVVGIDELASERIAFSSNPEWQAFEILDADLAQHQLDENGRTVAAEIGMWADRSLVHSNESAETTLLSSVDQQTISDLVNKIRPVTASGYQLPDTWSFEGVGISDMRRFWDSIVLIANFHLARNARTACVSEMSSLMVWPRSSWIECIRRCSLLDTAVVARMFDVLVYYRQHKLPDIAITPFIDIGGGLLAASAWMVVSSSMERNFCAHLAREDERYHQVTESLHHDMARQLASAFEQAGFSARIDVPIQTDIGNTEIDLLVWSPSERFLVAIELKWVIAVGDVMEVFNRGEAAAIRAIDRQLPRYSRALAANAGRVVQHAFGLPGLTSVDGWQCGLVLRGYVGSPRTRVKEFFTLPEELVHLYLDQRRTLRSFCEWAIEMPFLPVIGRDFVSEVIAVRSPSGIQVSFYEAIRTTPP